MKSYQSLSREQSAATARESRACMRAHALEYRMSIHPGGMWTGRNWTHRTETAAFYLDLAIHSRNRAATYSSRAQAA